MKTAKGVEDDGSSEPANSILRQLEQVFYCAGVKTNRILSLICYYIVGFYILLLKSPLIELQLRHDGIHPREMTLNSS